MIFYLKNIEVIKGLRPGGGAWGGVSNGEEAPCAAGETPRMSPREAAFGALHRWKQRLRVLSVKLSFCQNRAEAKGKPNAYAPDERS